MLSSPFQCYRVQCNQYLYPMLLFINQLQKTTKISDKAIATKYQILQFNDSADLQNFFPEETFIYSEKKNKLYYTNHSANIYLFKVNDRNITKRCKIYLKLTVKTPEQRRWSLSGVFIVDFEHVSHLFLQFILLTLNK